MCEVSYAIKRYIFKTQHCNWHFFTMCMFMIALFTSITDLSAVQPEGREMHTAVVSGSSIFVFGGRTTDAVCDEFYEFDTGMHVCLVQNDRVPNTDMRVYVCIITRLYKF